MREIGRREELQLFLHYGVEADARLFRRALARFPDLEELWSLAESRRLSALDFLPEACRARLLEAAEAGFTERFADRLRREGVTLCMPSHEEYPALLKEIHDPPALLFVRGRLTADMPLPIAIVGARAATDYGRSVARRFGL
ncbi:MAG: DNA-processing protein DprA, partial [Clostridia bacterium]|nr:DNA-processing protein DprA [Clostridia bacterium]